MDLTMEQKIDKALSKIEGHEKVCAVRYQNIENILQERGGRLTRLEQMIWGIYALIIGSGITIISQLI